MHCTTFSLNFKEVGREKGSINDYAALELTRTNYVRDDASCHIRLYHQVNRVNIMVWKTRWFPETIKKIDGL